jgi:hypothetical protein
MKMDFDYYIGKASEAEARSNGLWVVANAYFGVFCSGSG